MNMKVLHISSNDVLGGAAKACLALDSALRKIGVDSSILVQKKVGSRENVYSISNSFLKKYKSRFREGIEFLYNKYLVDEKHGRFSPSFFGANFKTAPLFNDADVIHLHWINEGFLSMHTFGFLFELRKPIVWTLHDMWAITGGCHYNGNCSKYLEQCSDCPALRLHGKNDVSFNMFERKKELFGNADINIVTCSNWLAGEVKRSQILKNKKVIAIPNTIDESKFYKVDKRVAREKLDLPGDKIYLLFGSMTVKDERKGFRFLLDALNCLFNSYENVRDKIGILLIGRMDDDTLNEFKFPVTAFGRINDDEKLNYIYNSADVFIAPSLQDNLPNTIMESLVCGLPSVGFNIGGIPDMVDHMQNGFLAEDISGESLAAGIHWCVSDTVRNENLGNNCRKKYSEHFSPDIVAGKYINLYKSLF